MKVAIVGAGMAGLACAGALAEAGASVTVFDKGRGPGGRMATRRLETPLGEASFDFGAQYFTARDPGFIAQVARWEAAGMAAPWPQARPDAWVGVPAMNTLLRDLAGRRDVRFGRLVKGLLREDEGWHVVGQDFRAAAFDAVVLALPAEQTAPLLTLHDFTLSQAALYARSQPCWTAMFAFAEPLSAPDVLRDTGAIAWAARNSAKPGRGGPESWVVQATPNWSAAHLERGTEEVGVLLLEALARATGVDAEPAPVAQSVHRWRYALSAGTGIGALWNAKAGIGACGDWLLGPRVECAWLSGRALAAQMLDPQQPATAAAAE